MNAEYMEAVTANAFRLPSHATSIEAHIGAEMLKNVRKGGTFRAPVAETSTQPTSGQIEERRARVVEVVRSIGRAPVADVIKAMPQKTLVIRNDLIRLCEAGVLDRDLVVMPSSRAGHVYWVVEGAA
jgi:hypothetical protein